MAQSIEIPGNELLQLIRKLLYGKSEYQLFADLLYSELFVYIEDDKTVGFALWPKCECESCMKVKELIQSYSDGVITRNELFELIEKETNGRATWSH